MKRMKKSISTLTISSPMQLSRRSRRKRAGGNPPRTPTKGKPHQCIRCWNVLTGPWSELSNRHYVKGISYNSLPPDFPEWLSKNILALCVITMVKTEYGLDVRKTLLKCLYQATWKVLNHFNEKICSTRKRYPLCPFYSFCW